MKNFLLQLVMVIHTKVITLNVATKSGGLCSVMLDRIIYDYHDICHWNTHTNTQIIFSCWKSLCTPRMQQCTFHSGTEQGGLTP